MAERVTSPKPPPLRGPARWPARSLDDLAWVSTVPGTRAARPSCSALPGLRPPPGQSMRITEPVTGSSYAIDPSHRLHQVILTARSRDKR